MGQDGTAMRTSGDRATVKAEAETRGRSRESSLERALEREFPVICFAWDGTAVARRADAAVDAVVIPLGAASCAVAKNECHVEWNVESAYRVVGVAAGDFDGDAAGKLTAAIE